MRLHHLAAAAAVALGLAGSASASDSIKLRLPGGTADATTFDLKARPADLDLGTDAARWGWRGGWGGGWRGGYWGGGYRGFYGGYRPFWGGGWGGGFRPGWGGWGGPVYYSVPVFNYYPSYAYYGGFYSPCSLNPPVETGRVAPPAMPRILDNSPPAGRPAPGGTFDYDGGPKEPVPMPQKSKEESAAVYPRQPKLVTELPVGLPVAAPAAKSGKWVYPAYGEAPRRGR